MSRRLALTPSLSPGERGASRPVRGLMSACPHTRAIVQAVASNDASACVGVHRITTFMAFFGLAARTSLTTGAAESPIQSSTL